MDGGTVNDGTSSKRALNFSVLGALLLGGILYYFFVLSVASMADVKLKSIGGKEVEMAKCEAETCLIVFIAADCTGCGRFADLVKDLRYILRRGYGVPTRVVIGGGTPERCRQVAMDYGSDTLIDPLRTLNVRDSHEFIVIDRAGKVVKTTDAPKGRSWTSPVPDQTLRDVAKELGAI